MTDEADKPSNLTLAARAAGATVAWAASGFANVDDETYRARCRKVGRKISFQTARHLNDWLARSPLVELTFDGLA